MGQATKVKLQKAQAQTVDTEEAKKFETKPVKIKAVLGGYKYHQPIDVLIRFELAKRNKTFKIMNKQGVSYTAAINDALDLLLFCKGHIKEEEVKAQYVRDIIKTIYKPIKRKSKKQE